MRISSYLLMGLAVLALCESVVSDKVHASVLNHLGGGKSINIHCQSKDNDLGEQTVADGGKFGWDFSVNVVRTTLFYCDLNWENFSGIHFDAYSFQRDRQRCKTRCLWMVSQEGMYGLNDRTGLWEFMYSWNLGQIDTRNDGEGYNMRDMGIAKSQSYTLRSCDLISYKRTI